MQQPQDPILLMSLVNTYLRDKYKNPEELCDDLQWDLGDLTKKLKKAGFTYKPDQNQYR